MEGRLQEKRVLCKACWSGGQLSKVYVKFSEAPLGEGTVFYDEEGRMHNHVPRGFEDRYKCSKGHEWVEKDTIATCWCGWTQSEAK